ncbi:MAG: hypothetical protein ACOCXH_06630 [Cyclobacteriaceae bacterium]
MKKKILSQLFIVSFTFAGLFLVVQNVKADPVSPPGNAATCYSTYSDPFLGIGGTYIFRCGTCGSVKASSFSDPGICNF